MKYEFQSPKIYPHNYICSGSSLDQYHISNLSVRISDLNRRAASRKIRKTKALPDSIRYAYKGAHPNMDSVFTGPVNIPGRVFIPRPEILQFLACGKRSLVVLAGLPHLDRVLDQYIRLAYFLISDDWQAGIRHFLLRSALRFRVPSVLHQS